VTPSARASEAAPPTCWQARRTASNVSMPEKYTTAALDATALLRLDEPVQSLPVEQAHIAKKVRWVFETLGVSRALVMQRCELHSKSAITGWIKTGRVAKKHLPVLAELSSTTLDWWHDTNAPVPPNSDGLVAHQNLTRSGRSGNPVAYGLSQSGYRIPRQTVAVAFAARLAEEGFVDTETAAGSVLFSSDDAEAFAVRCIGDAMSPRIEHGEFVLVEPGRPPLPGRDVYVRLVSGTVAIRRLAYERDGRVHLECINRRHPPQAVALDEIAAIYPVAARIESFRFSAEP